MSLFRDEGWALSSRAEELARKRSWIERIYAASINNAQGVVRATSDSIRSLPSFFVIGPPRTGTTWLYEILQERTLLPAPTKETRFFDTHFHRGIEWYRAHFPASTTDQRIGEIAPTYFASSEASERIANILPKAKVVCVFRNPVERVMSLYKLKCAYGLIPWTFEQAMVRDPEMLESSRYATKLKAWQRALGKDQVLATVYDDLRDEPQSFLNRLVDFIGVPRFELTASQTRCVHTSETMTHPRSYHRTRSASTMADWFKARRLDGLVAAVRNSSLRKLFLGGGPPFAELPLEIVLSLYERFRPEVEELETMLNRDLSAWKSMGEHSLSTARRSG
ncbi:MAG: sulfotransferase [Terriglobales bacterium]